jgi:hypothetical protein
MDNDLSMMDVQGDLHGLKRSIPLKEPSCDRASSLLALKIIISDAMARNTFCKEPYSLT